MQNMFTTVRSFFQIKPSIEPEAIPLIPPENSEQTNIADRAAMSGQKETTSGRALRRNLFKGLDREFDQKRHVAKHEDKVTITRLHHTTMEAVQDNDPHQTMRRIEELLNLDVFKSLGNLPNSDAKQRLKQEVTNANLSLMNNPYDGDTEFYASARQAKEALDKIDRGMLKQRRSAQKLALAAIESGFPHVTKEDKATVAKKLTAILPNLEYNPKVKGDAQRRGAELLGKMLRDVDDDGDQADVIKDLEVAIGTFGIRKHKRTMGRIFDFATLSSAEKKGMQTEVS